MIKICHFTIVHNWMDVRIFLKECSSLAKEYEVVLIAPGDLEQKVNDVRIVPVTDYKKRSERLRKGAEEIYQAAIMEDAAIYHFHDPELIKVGLWLKRMGKKVIFDVHENVALQIRNKPYIPKIFRPLVSIAYRWFEKKQVVNFDGLVLAEDSYLNYYEKLNQHVQVVLNMPITEKLSKFSSDRSKADLFYIGGVTLDRGFELVCSALDVLNKRGLKFTYHCVGPYDESLLSLPAYLAVKDNVVMHGRLPLYEGLAYAEKSFAGLSILKPIQNYKQSYSTKIFEYMAMGLPVITSNFPLYVDVIEKHSTGICVPPEDIAEIANSIEKLWKDKALQQTMSENGKEVTKQRYNWAAEEAKLLAFYRTILANS